MSRTPETIVDGRRKFVHDVYTKIAQVFFTLALAALLASFAGGKVVFFFVFMAAALFFNYRASKIKYTLKKEFEVGGFRRV